MSNRKLVQIDPEIHDYIEDLGTELDRSFAYTSNLLIKDGLKERGIIKKEAIESQ